ncbi:hypothetical protein BDW72DRAFT_105373 [Aspergillus terricola var. indicus]
MHLPNLLLASALTLAPAIYGYGIATVGIAYHEACHNGEAPNNSVDDPESTVVTKDTCTQLPAKHSFEIDSYSLSATPVTKDTTFVCHAVGIYTNDECVGLPITVIPLFPEENEAKTPCISDGYFEKNVSVKLFCEDEQDNDHEEHKNGDKHGDSRDDDEEEGGEDVENREMQTPEAKPKGMGGLFDSLNL